MSCVSAACSHCQPSDRPHHQSPNALLRESDCALAIFSLSCASKAICWANAAFSRALEISSHNSETLFRAKKVPEKSRSAKVLSCCIATSSRVLEIICSKAALLSSAFFPFSVSGRAILLRTVAAHASASVAHARAFAAAASVSISCRYAPNTACAFAGVGAAMSIVQAITIGKRDFTVQRGR